MKKGVFVTSLSMFFKHFFSYVSLSLLYATFILITLFISYFFAPLIILFIPTLIVPLTFAFHYSCNSIRDDEGFSFVTFFKGFGLYFTNRFRGGYYSIRNLLLSFLIFGVIFFATFIPFESYELARNTELAAMFGDVSVNYEELYELILANQTLKLGMLVSIGVSTLVSIIVFFLMHLHNSLNISGQLSRKVFQPMMVTKQFFTYQKRLLTKTYYKEFIKIAFLIFVPFVVGYLGGFTIHYFLISKDEFYTAIFSLIIGFGFVIPLLPFISLFMDNIVKMHRNTYNICYAKAIVHRLYGFERLPISEQDKEQLRIMKDQAEEVIKNTEED